MEQTTIEQAGGGGKSLSIFLPVRLVERVDYLRHDVSRSKFLARIIADHFKVTGMDQIALQP